MEVQEWWVSFSPAKDVFFLAVGPKFHIKELILALTGRELWVILWYFQNSLNKQWHCWKQSFGIFVAEIISVDRLRASLKSSRVWGKEPCPSNIWISDFIRKKIHQGQGQSPQMQPIKAITSNESEAECFINISLSIHLLCNLSWDHWDLWFLLEIYDVSMFCSLICWQKIAVFFSFDVGFSRLIFFMIWCFFRGPKLKEWRAYTDVVKLGLLCMCRTGVSSPMGENNQHGMVVS